MRPLLPLTERILGRLPGPRTAWILVWAAVPWVNAAANVALDGVGRSAVWEQGRLLVILNYCALSFAVLLTVWGTRRIARRLEALRPEPFAGMNSIAGPVGLTIATAVALGIAALVRDGWDALLLRSVTWFVLGIALWTFLWTYGALQLGLDRLGREHVIREAVSADPGLGLQPLGSVAFTGLWIFLAWLVPVVLTGLPDVVGVIIGLVVLVAGLSAFFLSLLRLHRQMLEVKAQELAIARDLYAQAYEPVRAARTLDALEQQRGLVGAADTLEKRASSIDEWPITERTFARLITITTSVIAMTIGRLILDPLGL